MDWLVRLRVCLIDCTIPKLLQGLTVCHQLLANLLCMVVPIGFRAESWVISRVV